MKLTIEVEVTSGGLGAVAAAKADAAEITPERWLAQTPRTDVLKACANVVEQSFDVWVEDQQDIYGPDYLGEADKAATRFIEGVAGTKGERP